MSVRCIETKRQVRLVTVPRSWDFQIIIEISRGVMLSQDLGQLAKDIEKAVTQELAQFRADPNRIEVNETIDMAIVSADYRKMLKGIYFELMPKLFRKDADWNF